MGTSQAQKKKILFISREDEPVYSCGKVKGVAGDYLWIVKALLKKYDVHTFHDLNMPPRVVKYNFPLLERSIFFERVFNGLACGEYRYDALITNPCRNHDDEHPRGKHSKEEFFSRKYQTFLKISRELKTAQPELPIMIYSTSIDLVWVYVQEMFREEAGIDLLVKRDDGWRQDVRNVRKGLDYLLNRLPKINEKSREIASTPPEIRKYKGNTLVSLVMNHRKHLGPNAHDAVTKHFEGCNRKISFVKRYKLTPDEQRNIYRPLLYVPQGKRLRVEVEGDDFKADVIARRMYSALTSESYLKMRFDTWQTQEEQGMLNNLR